MGIDQEWKNSTWLSQSNTCFVFYVWTFLFCVWLGKGGGRFGWFCFDCVAEVRLGINILHFMQTSSCVIFTVYFILRHKETCCLMNRLAKAVFPSCGPGVCPRITFRAFQDANFYASPHICQTRIRYWGLEPMNMSFTFSPGDVYDNCIKGIPANRQCSQFKHS